MTAVEAWNYQFFFIILLSLIPPVVLGMTNHYLYRIPLLLGDFLLLQLALFPMRDFPPVHLILVFTHLWLVIYHLKTKWMVPYIIIVQLVIQYYAGDALVAGIFISGLTWWARAELAVAQGLCILMILMLNRIGRRSDKALEQRILYEQNLTNLLETNLDLQNYAIREKRTVRQDERKRIAGELHDTLMHSLLNLKMTGESMRDHLLSPEPKVAKLLDLSESILDSIWTNIEQEIYDIRNRQDRDKEGLNRIHDMVKTFCEATQINVRIEYGDFPLSLGDTLDRILYRVIQEGLTNAFRHGRADYILVLLRQSSESYHLLVRDNGRGSSKNSDGGMGLWGIQQRLAAVGGSVTFHSGKMGFEINASIPKRTDHEED